MAASLDLFERLLAGHEHLLSDRFGAADVRAFPFLKYAVLPPDPTDEDPFHPILADHLRLAEGGRGHPRLGGWIARVDARPRV